MATELRRDGFRPVVSFLFRCELHIFNNDAKGIKKKKTGENGSGGGSELRHTESGGGWWWMEDGGTVVGLGVEAGGGGAHNASSLVGERLSRTPAACGASAGRTRWAAD